MQAVSRALRSLLLVLCAIGILYAVVANWSYVFSKVVRGEVMEVERVIQPTTMIGSNVTAEQMFSFAVLVRSENGEIFSSSSVDRQWAVVRKGYCVETRLYPYPPWDMDKADTYFNARLVKVLSDCKRVAGAQTGAPTPIATAAPITLPGTQPAGQPAPTNQSDPKTTPSATPVQH